MIPPLPAGVSAGISPTRSAAAAAAATRAREASIEAEVLEQRGDDEAKWRGDGKDGRRWWGAPRFKASYTFGAQQGEPRGGAQEAGAPRDELGLGIKGMAAGEARGGGKRRKRATVPPTAARLKAVVAELAAAAYAPSTKRAITAAMGAWEDFRTMMAEERPVLLKVPSFAGDMEASLHNETSLMLFAAWMIEQGLAASTVGTYMSLTKTNLGMMYGWALTCRELEMRLPKLLKGIRRMHKRIRKKRLGWRAVYEKKLRALIGEPGNEDAKTQTAIRCTLRQGLLRGADVVPERANLLDPERHSLVRDLEHFEASQHFDQPYFRLSVLPAKKGEQQGKDEYVYLPKGNGITDAYTAIVSMREERMAGGTWQDDAPLWLTTRGVTWTVAEVRGLFKASGKTLGIDTTFLGAHCGRIGGATDLFAEGCDAVLLQMQGRWYAQRRPEPPPPARARAPHANQTLRTEAYAPASAKRTEPMRHRTNRHGRPMSQ